MYFIDSVFVPCRIHFFYIIIQDLQKREEILAKKEAMLDEKNELEMKKLRSSQVISKVIES